MKKTILGLLIASLAINAGSASKPKFSVVPVGNPNVNLPLLGIQAVAFQVTNNTKLTRTLTFKPTNGVIQNTTGPGVCKSPFTLAYGQSCFLTLIASENNADFNFSNEGPIVCKTNGNGDNNPNPFLCSQPDENQRLTISIPERTPNVVKCWGFNEFGQLGNDHNYSTQLPNPDVSLTSYGLNNVVQVGGGSISTCVLNTKGQVYCWGNNGYGQLGVNAGAPNPDQQTYLPNLIEGFAGRVKTITVGESTNCALLYDGTVQCWGFSRYGQTGIVQENNPIPSTVTFTETVLKVTSGGQHICALLSSNRVACWGYNQFGQLGFEATSGTDTPNPTPTIIEGLTNVVDVQAGRYFNCALNNVGEIWCWGNNWGGMLGNSTGDTDQLGAYPTPTRIDPALLGGLPVAIRAGQNNSCALFYDNTVKCWGFNQYGQLGNGTFNSDPNPNPTQVIGIAGTVAQLISFDAANCVLLTNGRVQCWGWNKFGQLGNSSNVMGKLSNPSPSYVDNLFDAQILMVGSTADHVCTLVPNS
jgi:alpha-tubulin suppressor-like RCC1 family protein